MGPIESGVSGDHVGEDQEAQAAQPSVADSVWNPARDDRTARVPFDPALSIAASVIDAQIHAVCAEIGALEFNHREAMRPRYERLAHLSRELSVLQGASK